MDQPEKYETSNQSLFDKFESERNVDPIPMEDLNEEQQEEKTPHDTKDTVSGDKKYSGK
jgi:hypothetical protein